MQTEKSQPSGQRIMPETRKPSFPVLSDYPFTLGLGFLGLHRNAGVRFYFSVKSNLYLKEKPLQIGIQIFEKAKFL